MILVSIHGDFLFVHDVRLWYFFIVVQWFCKITLMILCPIQKYTVHTNNQFCWVLQLPTILYCSRHHVVTIMYFAV
ncbi:hypothetical protein HanPI659440_Chr15g0582621 [Helianthus annuus]|nr:hypothetical protein HanPI659440_Chr15g0582621 [Helianthus annuus]